MTTAFSNIFGSVMMRLALIYGALAIMTGTAIAVAWIVFQAIAANMQVLSQERLPELRDSAQIVDAADEISDILTNSLIASSKADLDQLNIETAELLDEMTMHAEAFRPEKAADLTEKISSVRDALAALKAARADLFASDEAVEQAVRDVMKAATAATEILAKQTDSAYFNLVLGSNDTVDAVDQTLSRLIDEDFALFQAALETRSEINLLSGLALGASQTRDRAMLSILEDLGNGASERVDTALTTLANAPTTQDAAAEISATLGTFQSALSRQSARIASNDILAARQAADAVLSLTLDDIYFDLVIKSDDAKSANQQAIRNLMDDQVSNIRAQAALDSATKGFFAQVMQVALARDDLELVQQTDALALAETRLREVMGTGNNEVQTALEPMLAIADPQTGIGAIRSTAFDANNAAMQAAQRAAASVREITETIAAFSASAQDNIDATARMLSTEVATAREWMTQIGIASLVLTFIAPLLIWRMVSSPLNHVTMVTERLASGDLSEIEGLDGKKGEIGRMASALKVFREGALERIRMQEEEREREARALEAQREADRAKREAEEQERIAEKAREAEEREREKREQERIDEARRATEAERQARAAEQEAVVGELAQSLQRLSSGDFTHTIDTEFPGTYETLRQDYNAAIENLAGLVRTISMSAGSIDASSSEIAASSLDLSRRTENSAATLEETAAALSELTASVSSAAEGASTASKTVETVKANAEASHGVMQNAVSAMSQIEESSSKITKIVEVIDSIAFQTNLLALNAGVEAARAGEAGRGFAVVASEVRVLAHRCSDAATQINALISESAAHVGTGVDMMDQTQKALNDILTGIVDMSKNVSEIAVSAKEQSSGINEINTAVEQLDRSTQQNAAMFEETTAASQSLTSDAKELAQLVAGFKVPGPSGSAAEQQVPQENQRARA